METYDFPCGCKIPVISSEIKECDGLPSLRIPYDDIILNLNYEKGCPETWKLLGTGNTKGVFQLESNLGQSWSKKLQPSNVEEMAALGALLRPGCLRVIVDGKSVTQHYVDRKFNREEITYFHEALEPILASTYGLMTFQEQAMRIATNIAGYNEQEADILRKAIGKKKADIMASLKDSFLEGCKKQDFVSEKEAAEIFAWIQESQRYSFNASHAVCYGNMGYLSAFTKYHFPLHFYCSWIIHARDKQKPQEEIRELISDAKKFDIEVGPPNIKTIRDNHSDVCIHDNHVYFGIRCVKKIGDRATDKFLSEVEVIEERLGKPVKDWSWLEILVLLLPKVNKTTINNLISVGLLSHLHISRQEMLFHYSIFSKLSQREKKNCEPLVKYHDNLVNLLENLTLLDKKLGIHSDKRRDIVYDLIKSLKNPPKSLDDKPSWIITQEKNLLGTSLSLHKVDSIDTHLSPNTTCQEFNEGKSGDCVLLVDVVSLREYTVPSNQKKMGFLTVEDQTDQMNCVMFSDQWEEFGHQLSEGVIVAILGRKSKKGSFQIEKVYFV